MSDFERELLKNMGNKKGEISPFIKIKIDVFYVGISILSRSMKESIDTTSAVSMSCFPAYVRVTITYKNAGSMRL